jgi:CubicO group peptidase (beta-lactamase class C family)
LDLLGEWPDPPAAAGVLVRRVTPNGVSVDLAGSRGDLDAESGWASVTKLLVAFCVLSACEEGLVTLVDPAGPPGATVAHLLSHASGLGPEADVVLTAPGRRRIYSNAAFEVAASHLAQRCGRPWSTEIHERVTGPAGMHSTRIAPGSSPAWGAIGTLRDLLAFGEELLAPTILTDESLRLATETAFPGLPGVVPGVGRYDLCDWGLGFELKGSKRPHWTATRGSPETFGHFGRSGAFIWVDPVAGVAVATTGGAAFGPWALEAWPRFSDAVLREFAPSV